jgi:hypothetical protein
MVRPEITMKAKLKRALDPPVFTNPFTMRYDTILDITEPLNGWNIANATMIIDWTMLAFQEGAVSQTGAIRCTNVVAFWDGYMQCKTAWGSDEQLAGSASTNCQVWPCCAMGNLMFFPMLWVASDSNPTGQVLTPDVVVGGYEDPTWAPDGIKYLQIAYGRGSCAAPLRIYTSIDIQMYASDRDYIIP